MKFNAPRGTHDLWGTNVQKIRFLEELCIKIFEKYNYSEIRFPTFEDAGLFSRSIGETTDIVEKEMYLFEDKKGRKLALRPEGTASVVRALLENNILQDLALGKLYYVGPMFRYERPQSGRYREFYQVGAEYFGNQDPSADAEIICLSVEIMNALGIQEPQTHINTLGCVSCRPKFKES
ncbi:MAG: ATP phosphoribosyltransferase regulatory subunit, partial [Elusimicrobia bacterium]|nr:ATP phosphoribosyltransferase regulatory subunit [Elusimicrobiota bacterium]